MLMILTLEMSIVLVKRVLLINFTSMIITCLGKIVCVCLIVHYVSYWCERRMLGD